MRIHIADDENPKLENISNLIGRVARGALISSSRSVRSTILSLRTDTPDILFLDMSLPTFDVAQGEQGGRAQGFGGLEVLRYMEFYEIECPTVIVTQYEAFSENGKAVDISSLSGRLSVDHPNSFKEIVYYGGSSHEGWQERLTAILSSIEVKD